MENYVTVFWVVILCLILVVQCTLKPKKTFDNLKTPKPLKISKKNLVYFQPRLKCSDAGWSQCVLPAC